MAEAELFERFHSFSRAHEDWDLDELSLLIVNLTIALLASTIYQSRKLRRVVREREKARRNAEKNARHDPLTGLLNRRAFTALLDVPANRGHNEFSRFLVVLDLDRFKPINDLHGHAAGDATLRLMALRFAKEVEEKGKIARLGGDEFAVLFSGDVDAIYVERCARRILRAAEIPIKLDGVTIHGGCSIGLAKWPANLSSSAALHHADKALYQAKKNGRGQFAWYDSELDQRSVERAKVEMDLRQAIQRNEIEPWFQPIVDIQNHSLMGFEVLARWNHATLGQIPPTEFIEIAEDSGQISNLGNAILKQACRSARNWDPRLNISFNISPQQFQDRDLVAQVRHILDDTEFPPARLTIEVTEGSVIRDFDAARSTLLALKDLGIAVALDDFGTGYSSLASLRQLPFDRIKIDRSFVSNIASHPQNQKIVTGIMALARGLELDVTAEGIESESDLEFLNQHHCALGQGFLFEKAVPAERVNWMLETHWADFHFDLVDRSADTADIAPRSA